MITTAGAYPAQTPAASVEAVEFAQWVAIETTKARILNNLPEYARPVLEQPENIRLFTAMPQRGRYRGLLSVNGNRDKG